MSAAVALAAEVGIVAACLALALARATYYRHTRPRPAPRPRPSPARALGAAERQEVLALLNAPRFADKAPATVFATRLDEGQYHCSIRTMYRLLHAHRQVRERRDLLRHPVYARPELLATAPNQVWSWDITKLRGPAPHAYFQLYVILDIFSRYVVGWMVAPRESALLAQQLIDATVAKQGVPAGQLTLHADRGTAMTAKPVALLLADLGVVRTHSRPQVSNDNPYSEAQFKTLKYRPEFPGRFGSLEDARQFCQAFFRWYNAEHRHSGIGLMTPATVHYGRVAEVNAQRQTALTAAFQAHPERFVRRPPAPPAVPTAAWINRPRPATQETLQ